MSTFEGRMLEYSFISLDRFDGENLSSTMFFLSHTHFDHTHGLDQPQFLEVLENRPSIYLYCSKMVKNILLRMYSFKKLEPYVKALEVNCPTLIEVPKDSSESTSTTITVTLLQAGHCLGSVMFLIEGSEGTVLYTGDFRWEENEFSRMPWLKSGDNVKSIKSLYVDSTFCIPEAFHLPTRTQSYEAVFSEVNKHFRKCDDNYVCIFSKTGFGYEHLLEKLAKAFKTKVHVDADYKFSVYDTIPKLKDVFTTSTENTKIHFHKTEFCPQLRQQKLKYYNEQSQMLIIKVSVMWFVEESRNMTDNIDALQWVSPNNCRVCYSFHPSYQEVQALVRYLKPQHVLPNVCPINQSLEQTRIQLNEFLNLPIPKKQKKCLFEENPLGIMKLKEVPEICYPPRDSIAFSDSDNLKNSFSQQSQLSISESTCSNDNVSSSSCNIQGEGSKNVTLQNCSIQKNMPEDVLTSSCNVHGVESDGVMPQRCNIPRDMSEDVTSRHCTKLSDTSEDMTSQHCNIHREMSIGRTSQSCNDIEKISERVMLKSYNIEQIMSEDIPSQQCNSHEKNLECVTSHHCNSQSHSLENMPQHSSSCEFRLPTMAAKQRRDNENILINVSSKHKKNNEIALTHISPMPIANNQDILRNMSPKHKENKEKLTFDVLLEHSEKEKYKISEGNEKYVNCHKISTKNYTKELNEDKEMTNHSGNPNQILVLDQRDSKIIPEEPLVNLSQIFGSLNCYFSGDSNEIVPDSDANTKQHVSSTRMSETSPNKNKSEVKSSALSEVTKSFFPAKNNDVTSTFSVDDMKTVSVRGFQEHDRSFSENDPYCTTIKNNVDEDNNNNTINESLNSETRCSISETSEGANKAVNKCCISKVEIPTNKTVSQSQSICATSKQLLGKRKHETAASYEYNYKKKFCDIPLINHAESSPSHTVVLENCTEMAKPAGINVKGESTTNKHQHCITQQECLKSLEEKDVNSILDNHHNSLESNQRMNLNSITLARSTFTDESQNNSNLEELCKSSADKQATEKSSSQSTIVLSDSQNSECDPDHENKNLSESEETMPPSPFSTSSNSEPLLSPQTLDRMSLLDNSCDINDLHPVNCHSDAVESCISTNQDDVVIIKTKVLRYVID